MMSALNKSTFNEDILKYDVSNVTDMKYMFVNGRFKTVNFILQNKCI